MTDRVKELIADCRKRARAAWETDGTIEGNRRRDANFRPDAIRDIEQLATLAEQAIARAEKAEADLRGYDEDWMALYQAIGLSRDETDAHKIGNRIRELVKAEADLAAHKAALADVVERAAQLADTSKGYPTDVSIKIRSLASPDAAPYAKVLEAARASIPEEWHSSDEDSGPDCGVALHVSDKLHVWCGELSDRALADATDGDTVSSTGYFIALFDDGAPVGEQVTVYARALDYENGRALAQMLARHLAVHEALAAIEEPRLAGIGRG